MSSFKKCMVLSSFFICFSLFARAQEDSIVKIKPIIKVIENDYEGVKVKFRVIERPDGVSTVLTQIRNNTSNAAAVLLISPDNKHQIKQILAPGETFTGNIGDVTNFAIGTHFFEHQPEEKRLSETIVDWMKVKIREYYILNNGGLEKEEKKGTVWGVRG